MSFRADGARWAIATPHAEATAAGVDAFERGGTAMDAALAAATTLAVAYPHMCGVGGDLFALIQRLDGGLVSISSSGRSPAGADPDALDGMTEMPIRGTVPITVPGAVAGWHALHASGARLPWADAFTHAIGLAHDGVAVSRSLDVALTEPDAPFADDPGLAAIFYPGGSAAALGSRVRQPALGRTLEALAAEGPEALYGGAVGRAYADGLAAAGSPLTLDDLAGHEAALVAPMRVAFRDLHVSTAPPNSQGFVLLQILALLERLGIEADMDGPDAGRIARVIEAANADRDRHLADPDRMAVHPSTLLDDGHLAGLADQASPAAPHDAAGAAASRADGDTIALVAADAEGRAVSLIQSLFWGFGSGICEPATGIVAQNRGACFTLEPGHPNRFAPGVRPFHTLMPVLIHSDDRLAGVAGSMGGYQQPQINLHTITRTFVGGAHPADAVAAPRWVVLGADEGNERPVVGLEPGVPEATRAALRDGTGFGELEDDGFGHAHLIRCTDDGFAVGSDPRADGAAAAG
jgi:gamma-glutamyltranspeptidase/glutathione hydrolase